MSSASGEQETAVGGQRLAKCRRCFVKLQTLTDPKILIVIDVQGQEERRLCFCGDCFAALMDWSLMPPVGAREAAARAKELLRECRSDLVAAGHTSPRCDYFGTCHCGLEDLLRRIDALLIDDCLIYP